MNTFSVVNRYDDLSNKLKIRIVNDLTANGFKYVENNPELIIVVGGDGTFLNAVNDNFSNLDNIYFCGIHTGTLGFFTDYKSDDIDIFISDILNLKPKIKEYQVLSARSNNNEYYAINEIRIENILRTQVLDIKVNGKEFETYRGTGICVCTQLGSTAYNRSLNGSVIQDNLPLIQMSEIAGIHHKEFRSLGSSIVMSDDSVLSFSSNSFNGAILCADSRSYIIDDTNEIVISKCSKKVRMLMYREISYFKKLQSLF